MRFVKKMIKEIWEVYNLSDLKRKLRDLRSI